MFVVNSYFDDLFFMLAPIYRHFNMCVLTIVSSLSGNNGSGNVTSDVIL